MRTIIKIAVWAAGVGDTVLGVVSLISISLSFNRNDVGAAETAGLIFGLIMGVLFLVVGVPILYFAIKKFQLPPPKVKKQA